jgi:hypothetical protein
MRASTPRLVTSQRLAWLISAAICISFASCSSAPQLGNAGYSRTFPHAHTVLANGRHQLTVQVVTAAGETQGTAVAQVDDFAKSFATNLCPKGVDLYADNPMAPKKKRTVEEVTFSFECR